MIRILFVIPYKEGEAVVQEVLAEKAYKKQIQYETLVAGVGERLTISQDRADAIISRGYTAVSYTHLDVYKRQAVLWCSMTRCAPANVLSSIPEKLRKNGAIYSILGGI